MNRMIAAAFLLGTFSGIAHAMPLAPADSPRMPASSGSPAVAARASIAAPMADACRTTPIRARMPARAAFTSVPAAAAAAMDAKFGR
jgi:hypothetical protein